MKKIQRVIMVDDDPYSNMICNYIIRQVAGDIELFEFTNPEGGIEYIESAYKTEDTCSTILLLDINMPEMTCWDFLERFDKAEPDVKEQITVYLLSSSIDHRDQKRAEANKYVKDFLVKPFRVEMAEKILSNLNGHKKDILTY